MATIRPSWFPGILLISAIMGMLGCGHPDGEPIAAPRLQRIDRSLSGAAAFLCAQQSPEGDWRPDTYGAFKDGASLTPLVLQALSGIPSTEELAPVYRKGTDYLANMVRSDGSIDAGPHGLSYPVYTAANAVLVLSNPCNAQYRKPRDAWLSYLRARQLVEELGWQPTDREYGGWGYASGLPRKPKPGEAAPLLTESNLSATAFALTALRSAGVPANDAAIQKARVFVQRCQNYTVDSKVRDPAFEDGGFFFIYADSVRNKAGVAGIDRAGRERYVSYGSVTADGVRALLACGLPVADDRVVAARSWLEKNFSAASHPGRYPNERLSDRPALYFYYCCSVAQALRALDVQDLEQPAGKVRWAEALAEEILKRQRADGSWVNSAKAVREDEPVLATSLAAMALAVCRERLSGKSANAIPHQGRFSARARSASAFACSPFRR